MGIFLALCLLYPPNFLPILPPMPLEKIDCSPQRLSTQYSSVLEENVEELKIYLLQKAKMPKKSYKFALFLAFFAICTAIPFGHTFSTDGFDPYQTLGLEMGATQNEIKQAYKKLAMEWHPDRNKSPDAQERFMEVNRAYEILSNVEKREAYDKFGTMDENFAEWRNYQEQFFREQQQKHFQQYIRWPPPPRRQQNDLKNFILPFASVLGTLFFIFLIGFVLNQMNSAEANTNRRRQNEEMSSGATRGNSGNNKGTNKEQQEWHPEDPKTPLREEEKQQRLQTRIWRTMGPLIHELRAETQFGLIRLLKPGCRSVILLVDKESKETLLHQFARYTYCLRNNKTFSFGFLVVPKNLNWFRSLLELTLPGDDEQKEESKEDLNSLTTVTTDTNSDKQEKEPDEKGPPLLGQFTAKAKKNEADEKKMTAKDRLKNINPKHTVGTILVICGWKLYFSIYHPMHRPTSLRTRNAAVQLETLGDNEEDGTVDEPNEELLRAQRKGSSGLASKEGKIDNKLNVANVLNGFPTFLERLLEGTVRRYYIPEWPENLI